MKVGIIDGLHSSMNDPKQIYAKYPNIFGNTFYNVLRDHGHEIILYPRISKPSEDVDLYHAHNIGLGALYAALNRKSPLIFTSHDPIIASRYKKGLSPLKKRLIHFMLKNADIVIALSNRESKIFIEDFNIPANKIRVINPGINADLFSLLTYTKDNKNNIKLLCIAHLEEYKGISHLLCALSKAKEKVPNIELRIISISRGLLKKYENLCSTLDINNNVMFLFNLSLEELIANYQWCDIYIHPSLAENFPSVITEAMMCGKPVIASRIAGIPEQVTEKTGILVEPGDIDEFARAIISLSENKDHRLIMGEEGRKRALVYFNKEVMYEQHMSVYAELLDIYKEPNTSLDRIFYRLILDIVYAISTRLYNFV